jgi:hypothetical protein
MKLRDWIPDEVLYNKKICSNPNAIYNLKVKHYHYLLENENIFSVLSYKDIQKYDTSELSSNPAAINYLRNNPDTIYWYILCGNPAAIHLLEANPDEINWSYLSSNPAAIELLRQIQTK